MVLISVGGLYISYRRHRCLYPLLITNPSRLLTFYSYHFNDTAYWIYFLFAGMTGLLKATTLNYKRNKMQGTCDSNTTVERNSTITCPNCGYRKEESMPKNACQYFYECTPKQGGCCVYCSYDTVKCPPRQAGNNCCN